MNEEQLFQKIDEQEAAHAAQQLSKATAERHAADVDEAVEEPATLVGGVVVPVVAASTVGGAAETGYPGGTGATAGPAPVVAAGAVIAEMEDGKNRVDGCS